MSAKVLLTGIGLELPSGVTVEELLPAAFTNCRSTSSPSSSPDLEEGGPEIGYRGQDLATRLALIVADTALGEAHDLTDATGIGVIVASTTSNIDTVARVASGVATESYRVVRPSDVLTIAGTQVTASLSSWFGARAFTYGSCAGHAAAHDALALAMTALRRGRAAKVLIVAVETPGPQTHRLMAQAEGARPMFTGAAAVIAELSTTVLARGGIDVGTVVTGQTVGDVVDQLPVDPDNVGLAFVPAGLPAERRDARAQLVASYPQADVIDLWPALGDTQGSLGLLQCVLAATWLAEKPHQTVCAFAGSVSDQHVVATAFSSGSAQ